MTWCAVFHKITISFSHHKIENTRCFEKSRGKFGTSLDFHTNIIEILYAVLNISMSSVLL